MQPNAFVLSRLAVGSVEALLLLAMRLAGLQLAVPFGLTYLIVVVFPFCAGVAG